MNAKRDFSSALRKSTGTQKQVIDARFAKADSVLLNIKSEVPSPPPPAEPTPKVEMVVRDTFTMPPAEHELIEQLRTIAAKEGRIVTKSEIVRAGLAVLVNLKPEGLLQALEHLVKVRPGRK